MIDQPQLRLKPSLPFKSVAGALIFSVLLGPVGLLYASVLGGAILIVLCMVAATGKYYTAVTVFWLISCVISVATVNRYNKKILQTLSLSSPA